MVEHVQMFWGCVKDRRLNSSIKCKQADFHCLWYKYGTGIPEFARCLALQPFLTIENPTDACGSWAVAKRSSGTQRQGNQARISTLPAPRSFGIINIFVSFKIFGRQAHCSPALRIWHSPSQHGQAALQMLWGGINLRGQKGIGSVFHGWTFQ